MLRNISTLLVLNANNRQQDILEPDHDPLSVFKDFTYLEGDDFKTARIFKVIVVSGHRVKVQLWNLHTSIVKRLIVHLFHFAPSRKRIHVKF